MEKANKKIIIIALVFSLITAVLIYIYITVNTKTDVPEKEYATVFVAAVTIPARSEIAESDVKQVKIAKELLSPNALTDAAEIVGKRTLESIIEGEQFRKERLADENSMFLSCIIPAGTRAVSINVTEHINVANLLRPGDFIDVIASFEKEEENNGICYPRITKIVLQNIRVLATGQDMAAAAEKPDAAPATVTLAIKKEDAEKFVYASEYGVLKLALRPVGDNAQIQTNGVMREDVTGAKGIYTKVPDGADQQQ